jgi:hypothetical protein
MPGRDRFTKNRTLRAAIAGGVLSVFPALLPAAALNACDLNGDGAVNVIDVQLATNMSLGVTPCTASVAGAVVCNPVVVQAIEDAALSGKCVPHSVTLNWTSSPSPNVTGYHVYRGAKSGGPYTKLTSSPVGATSFVDITVQAGQTYYYVTTAVDNGNIESVYSNQATAVIPSP